MLNIDPNIARARTLDTAFYTDKNYFKLSKEKIFAASWQLLADSDSLEQPGSLVPVMLLPEFLSEPILLSKDKSGQLHCLSNVCTHRGNLLVDKPCKLAQLTCKYHGRRFSLDGKFMSMPEFKEVLDFPTDADNLKSIESYRWGKFIFASLNPVIPAEDYFREIKERIGWYPFDKLKLSATLSKTYKVKANWALYCENFLEGFHIPFVHAGLNQVLDFGEYTTEIFRYANLQLGVAKDGELCFEIPAGAPDHGRKIAAYYFWVFPNLMLNFYPWGLSINIVRPLAIDQTEVAFLTYVLDESKINTGAGGDLHKVEIEDEEIVENVQKGVRSRFYQHGRYSVTREQGTHHFHSLIAEFMNR